MDEGSLARCEQSAAAQLYFAQLDSSLIEENRDERAHSLTTIFVSHGIRCEYNEASARLVQSQQLACWIGCELAII